MMMRVLYEACPLCDSKEVASTLTADCKNHALYKPQLEPTITWRQCAGCGHIYTEGYHSEEALALIFSDTHENQRVGFDFESQRMVSSRMVEKVLPFVDHGVWCDVGFGNGSLLMTAAEYGFEPVGIDLRKDNVEALASLGLEAHRIDLAEFPQAGRFDVVSLCDVLEHTPFPAKFLMHASKLLKPGGILFLSMPNVDSLAWQLLHAIDGNPYWGELEHYHNFGKQRLYALLERCGFTAIKYGVSERYRLCMEVVARLNA